MFKVLLTIVTTILFLDGVLSHRSHRHSPDERCPSEYAYEEAVRSRPDYAKGRGQVDKNAKEFGMAMRDLRPRFQGKNRRRLVGGQQLKVYKIPVVVHVAANPDFPETDIVKAQIDSMINRMNDDFNAENSELKDSSAYLYELAGNFGLEFELDRIKRFSWPQNCPAGNNDVKDASKGGSAAVDPKTHLNIWICKPGNGAIGWAYYPGMPDNMRWIDGIVASPYYVGHTDDDPKEEWPLRSRSKYGQNRMITHEAGHWLDLPHIWGTEQSCESDDGFEDTPTQYGPNFGCPSEPVDSCPDSPGNDAFVDYMDYTNDYCMYLFTVDQVIHGRSLFESGGFRDGFNAIDASGGLGTPAPSLIQRAQATLDAETTTTTTTTSPTTRPTAKPTKKPTTRPTTGPTERPTTRPTTKPTTKSSLMAVCGDGVCNGDEDCNSCPVDCRGVTQARDHLLYCCNGDPNNLCTGNCANSSDLCNNNLCRDKREQCTADSECCSGLKCNNRNKCVKA